MWRINVRCECGALRAVLRALSSRAGVLSHRSASTIPRHEAGNERANTQTSEHVRTSARTALRASERWNDGIEDPTQSGERMKKHVRNRTDERRTNARANSANERTNEQASNRTQLQKGARTIEHMPPKSCQNRLWDAHGKSNIEGKSGKSIREILQIAEKYVF